MKTLDRSLGLPAVIAISVSAMLSGLFVLPGLATAFTGPSVWLAFLVAGVCVLPAALSKSELATAMPVSGGSYVYIHRTFGALIGVMSGLGLWLSLVLKSGFSLIGLGAYLHVFVELPLRPTALVLLIGITALNIIGVHKVAKVQIATVAVALCCLVALTIWGALTFQGANLEPLFTHGGFGFIAATGFVYISYAGVTKIAAIAEEIKSPERNIPLGIIISLVAVTLIYSLVTLVLVSNLPAGQLHTDLKPIHTLANQIGGYWIGVVAAAVGIMVMTSMSVAGVLAGSRFPLAMARDDLIPKTMKQVSQRFSTPAPAILLTAGVMGVAIVFFDVARIAKLASSFMIIIFMLLYLVVIVLNESEAQWYKPKYRAPFYPYTQIFGLVTGLVLLWMLGLEGLIGLLVVVVLGGVLYVTYSRHRTEHRGVIGQLGPRIELLAELQSPTELDEVLPQQAAVVVPMFGAERFPELLVEVGSALAHNHKIEVVQLSELLDYELLGEDIHADDPDTTAWRRRIEGMNNDDEIDVEFDSVVSTDMVKTVHNITKRVHCKWMLMAWGDWTESHRPYYIRNPIGWLVNHLPCHLALFEDRGIRYIREIHVLLNGDEEVSLTAETAEQVASTFDATLTYLKFVAGDASMSQVQQGEEQLQRVAGLGERPAEIALLRGDCELAAVKRFTRDADILIVTEPAPTKVRLRDLILGTPMDRLTRQVVCSVLRLKPLRMKTAPHQATEGPRASLSASASAKRLHTASGLSIFTDSVSNA